MADVTITLDDQDLARARALAQAEGLSVEEWLRDLIKRGTVAPRVRPRDPLFGMFADEPELADAIDEVVAERQHSPLRTP
jgi:Ribbon-helix-helix protein, copG family